MVHFAFSALNVAAATSSIANPDFVWLNWAAAVFCFGLGIREAVCDYSL